MERALFYVQSSSASSRAFSPYVHPLERSYSSVLVPLLFCANSLREFGKEPEAFELVLFVAVKNPRRFHIAVTPSS